MKRSKIFGFEYFCCLFISFQRSFGFHDSDTIEDAMYMRINPKKWCIFCYGEKYFRCFDTHSWKLYEFFNGFWWLTCVLCYEYFTGFEDVFCFIVKKWNRVYEVCNFFYSKFYPVFGSLEKTKEISIDDIDLFICRLCWHRNSDEKLKLIFVIQLRFCIRKHLKYCFFEKFDFLFLSRHEIFLLDPGVKFL